LFKQESGAKTADLARKHGIAEATLYGILDESLAFHDRCGHVSPFTVALQLRQTAHACSDNALPLPNVWPRLSGLIPMIVCVHRGNHQQQPKRSWTSDRP
jgi:hypothetical protein